ncbi:Uncharacterised protein [Burkholderia pseudomallei]|nr:Uncharacterised protein [Burkholderia pseudomallei]
MAVAPLPALQLPPLNFGGGSAAPSNASDYNPVAFNDGAFVVSESPSLGTSVAGGIAGATNSFSFGSLTSFQGIFPWLLIGGVVWLVRRHRHKSA